MLAGWAQPGFDVAAWAPAAIASSVANAAVLSSALFEPTRYVSELSPRATTSPAAGVQAACDGDVCQLQVLLQVVSE